MIKIHNVIIVTGISGAGKTTVLNMLEDLGYTAMDNLPCRLGNFILEAYNRQEEVKFEEKIAIGMDIRSFKEISEYTKFLSEVKKITKSFELIYLDANDEVLLNRYALTRRKHPLNKKTLEKDITQEKEIMSPIKEISTCTIDTSFVTPKELTNKVIDIIHKKDSSIIDLTVHLQSFGFKYGVPKDADMIFDVRFLPNPYYVEKLKNKTGNDEEVQEYVMNSEISLKFKEKLFDMIEFLIPNFIREGKRHITIGIGCSGGKHRSVTFLNLLEEQLEKHSNLRVFKTHREEERGNWK